jgi:hypothetical protein
VPYVRTVKTASGAIAVQIAYSYRRGARQIEHIGSAHDDAELELLKAVARQHLAGGQGLLDLGPGFGGRQGGPLPITSSRMGACWTGCPAAMTCWGSRGRLAGTRCSAIWCWRGLSSRSASWTRCGCWRKPGLRRRPMPRSSGGCRPMRRARGGSRSPLRVRRMPGWARPAWCSTTSSTLYFETDEGDGFRESGFSKERRLEPQITIGLLTDQAGFPLMVSAFEGNKAESKTMLPVIQSFMTAHDLPEVTVVADAGMVSEANQKQIEAAGLSFILGARIPHVPDVVSRWRREHPDQDIPDGHVFTQPWPAGPNGGHRDQVIYYQYKADRARRALRGIDAQVAKAEQAVAGKTPVKRNRFVQLSGGTRTVNRELEQQEGEPVQVGARDLGGVGGWPA